MKKKNLDLLYNSLTEKNQVSNLVSIILPMTIITEKIHNESKSIFSEYDLTQSEFDMLGTLYLANEGLTASDVSERLIFTSGGISKVVKKLEFKGLVSKKTSLEDKRSSLLFITQKGLEIVLECIPKLNKIYEDYLSVLNETEKDIMFKAFKKILYFVDEK